MGKYDLLREYISINYEQYSGLTLEKYFRDKVAESERVTHIGKYWDKKGQNEIDLIALNKLDKKALVAEIKRNPEKINLKILEEKIKTIKKELSIYKVELKGFSMEDM
jgi:hypothetical protein